MVSTTKAINGFVAFLDKEMMAKLPNGGLQKVAVGVISALAVKRGEMAMEKLKANTLAVGLGAFDENGDIDAELLKDVVRENIPDEGIKMSLPIIGNMTFFKEDVDTLYRYISEAGEGQ